VPSHVAGIQLRRRLAAEHGAFAGVRFETLPRLAELLGAGDLARAGKSPLARPIGDYLASQVALEAGAELATVRHLPGFARVLRQTFRRLRRGGYEQPQNVPVRLDRGLLGEVVRLYASFRARTSDFYDDEDLQDAAALSVDARPGAVARELGEVYVLPPGALSAASDRLLTSIKRAVGRGHYHFVPDERTAPESRFVLAPDPASEVREVAREVVDALAAGAGLHEIGVFHGADTTYRALLSHAFESAGLPVNALPGVALSETAAGRGVLMLAELPLQNYSRTQVIDWLSLAPLKPRLPVADGEVATLPAPWRRLAREAGITQGIRRWQSGLDALLNDLDASLSRFGDEDETRRARYEDQRERVLELKALIEGLIARMEPLRQPQPASSFIDAFRAVVEAYMDTSTPAFTAVQAQIDQLGTIDKVGGRFSLDSFAGALRANLDAAYHREGTLGDGIFIADYRLAAGLSFKHTLLCGAYEGIFPAGAPAEPLMADRVWQELRERHPMIEDADLRLERAQAQAQRALASATHRLTWTAPLQASGAGREHYPAQVMVAAARTLDPTIESATDLRRASSRPWLRKPASPTAALLTGTPVDLTEVRIRSSVVARREGVSLAVDHPLAASQRLLAARRGAAFGPYDGNLSQLDAAMLIPRGSVSPTSLETYALCGFRYFLGHVLRLRPPEEPEDRETMDAAERGTIVHTVLQAFYQRRTLQPGEVWTPDDATALLDLLDIHMAAAHDRGKTGLDIYAEHELRRLRADLVNFLDHDNAFRRETGAVPTHFELSLPADASSAVPMRGYVDRIDVTPDGRHAWVIDYKTGRAYEGMKDDDPLEGGTPLQLPAYMAAVPDAETVTPLYWFITAAGEYTRKPFAATDANMARYHKTLDAILAGVRGGAFPAVSGEEDTRFGGWNNCRYCDFNRLCSRRRDDELWAKHEDPHLRPWNNVGETARRPQ
jgi:RecB family exonuclease